MKKKNGRYASETNRTLVRNAMNEQRKENQYKRIDRTRIRNETKLSYPIVIKYVKEIEGGK